MENTLSTNLNLLNQLMSAAGWHSNKNRLFEAMPHMSDRLSPQDMTKTLENLGVSTSCEACRLRDVTADDCPALFIDRHDRVRAIFAADTGKLLISGEAGAEAGAGDRDGLEDSGFDR